LVFSLFVDLSILGFVISYLFCFLFFTATNLWNHLNDAEDDLRDGRKEAKFLIEKRKEGVMFVVAFYILSLLVVIFFSHDSRAVFAFAISLLMTWLYSDKMFAGRYIRRLKEDYRTELLTYIFVTFAFFSLIWMFFSPINQRGIAFAVITSLFYISGVFLKDIKDITADTLAGYRTLAVVFKPQTLFKISATFNVLTLLLILFFSVTGIFPVIGGLTALVLIPVLWAVYSIRKRGWLLSLETVRYIKVYTFSYPLSLTLLGVLSLVVQHYS
jgi:1,4-dihydroxy-2-naphthoate octaprenyltransferase